MSKKIKLPAIDKGIPIPAKRDSSGIATVMRSLDVGDSFLAKGFAQSLASTYSKSIGIKVTTRKQPDGQIRIWRTA